MRLRFFRTGLRALALLLTISSPAAFGQAEETPDPALLAADPPRPGAAQIYFFSPDWRPPDLGALAVAVEQAMGSGGVDVSFQAFTRYEDFEKQMLDKPPVFLLAPAWIDEEPGNPFGAKFRVIARPLRRGKSSYRKALMTRPGIDSIDDLAHGSLAATLHSMGPGSAEAVLDAFHLAADSAKVVPVPKDVDALLALSFGQVDAALVTSEQYDLMSRSNRAEAERLRVLAFSPEVKLPPVFARRGADNALVTRFRDSLLRLPELAEGPEVLEMLGFDGFVSAEAAPPRDAATASDKPAGGKAPAPKPAPVKR